MISTLFNAQTRFFSGFVVVASSGETGIRTLGGEFIPRTHLAGEPNRPLWHLPFLYRQIV